MKIFNSVSNRKNLTIILFIFFSSIFVFNIIIINWGYLPFQYKPYDRKFNPTRLKLGQPIIENYFIPKFKGRPRNQFWLTPDSLDHKYMHQAKAYSTFRGKITFESDYYRNNSDSIPYQLIEREYNYETDSVIYHFGLINGRTNIYDKVIDSQSAYSILRKWRESYIH
jgi:hypothetical protein